MTETLANKWFICPKPNLQSKLRLFCFPYAGGAALNFRSWTYHLDPAIELHAVQLPGRGNRISEPPLTRVMSVVDALTPAFKEYSDKPLALYGYSMGAIVSFELARRLRKEYQVEPAKLLVGGRRAPHLSFDSKPIYSLPKPEFMDELRRLNGTPKEVLEHSELMELLLPLLRADFEICQTYAYQEDTPFSCPISAFGGLGDGELTREQLNEWRRQTRASFSLHMFPGDHFFINAMQGSLLEMISKELYEIL